MNACMKLNSAERIKDTDALREFGQAMLDRMDLARSKGRYGWHDPTLCPITRLRQLLARSIHHGDVVDVANYCMMLYHRGELFALEKPVTFKQEVQPELPITLEGPEPQTDFHMNRTGDVAVSATYAYSKDMSNCPRGTKVILLGKGGVAVLGTYDGDSFWTGWAALPRDPS